MNVAVPCAVLAVPTPSVVPNQVPCKKVSVSIPPEMVMLGGAAEVDGRRRLRGEGAEGRVVSFAGEVLDEDAGRALWV